MSSIESILGELRRLGKAGTAEVYRRHGVNEETVGLSFADATTAASTTSVVRDLPRSAPAR